MRLQRRKPRLRNEHGRPSLRHRFEGGAERLALEVGNVAAAQTFLRAFHHDDVDDGVGTKAIPFLAGYDDVHVRKLRTNSRNADAQGAL